MRCRLWKGACRASVSCRFFPIPVRKTVGREKREASHLHSNRLLPALTHHEAYLCGSPGMIDASIGVLRARGLPEALIFYDKFS